MSELKEPTTLEAVIKFMEATDESEWQTDVVRSKDGKQNCFFGHLFNMGADEDEANRIWDWFEARWATTFMLYPVNDGENPKYQQSTSKARVLAYLNALLSGEEENSFALMVKEGVS